MNETCIAVKLSILHLKTNLNRNLSWFYPFIDSGNPALCLDAEVALAAEQLMVSRSQQSSSATSHYSESRGETPCSFNDEDEDEDVDEDDPSPD